MDKTMTPQEMTTGQIGKAVANYRAMLEKHALDFPADAVQSVLGDHNFAVEQLRLFRERVEAKYPESQSLFKATFVTSAYFVTRSGLWVDSDFTSRITQAYPEALVPRGLDGVESFDLTKNLPDKTILGLPEMGGGENVRKHAFSIDQIADLITLQPEGVAGKLLSNGFPSGYYNLFYVVGANGVLFVVDVSWFARRRGWHVCAWDLGRVGCWRAGCRIFRNTQVLKA